jgi:ribosome-associated protein
MNRKIDVDLIGPELEFAVSRSGGPGGQNVNKVNSKVTIKWNVEQSTLITDDEKATLLSKLAGKLTIDNVLVVTSQEMRSQLENKETAKDKLNRMISKAFEQRKKRKATKPTKSSVKKRIQDKKQRSEKKQWRQQKDF